MTRHSTDSRRVLLALAMLAGSLSLTATPALAARPPMIAEQSASGVTQTAAILNTTIDPRGTDTHYHFQYVSAAGYQPGASNPYVAGGETPPVDIGASTTETVGGQQIASLEPDTTYHYRALAESAEGTAEGEDQTFTTMSPLPPIEVTTGPASEVTQNTATLSGTLNDQRIPTTYEFDLGPDTTYGTRIDATANITLGSRTYTVTLNSLAAGVTYHYRILARNVYGTIYGSDLTFTTPPYPTSILLAPPPPPLLPTVLITPAAATTTTTATHTTPGNTHTTATRRGQRARRNRAQLRKHPRPPHIADPHRTVARGQSK